MGIRFITYVILRIDTTISGIKEHSGTLYLFNFLININSAELNCNLLSYEIFVFKIAKFSNQ